MKLPTYLFHEVGPGLPFPAVIQGKGTAILFNPLYLHVFVFLRFGHFQYKDGEWHEVLIDIDSSPESGRDLRWVLSKQRTAANELLTMVRDAHTVDHTLDIHLTGGVTG